MFKIVLCEHTVHCASGAGREEPMRLDITQPPLNTSLMGVVKGVADFFGMDLSTPSLFGRTGHAFLMNIAEGLCPSGPYVWDMEPFIALLENSGIVMKGHGFFDSSSSSEEREVLEESLRHELKQGKPCSILNMDNQIINGFDETGFSCIQPWDCDYPPAHLTFGTWKEVKDEVHACFFSFDEVEKLEPAFCIQRSLLFALDQLRGKPVGSLGGSVSGIEAYSAWIREIENGHGAGHGNWWNGTVWAECRRMASGYFGEISECFPGVAGPASELEEVFGEIAGKLEAVSDKELDPDGKVRLLGEARSLEEGTEPLLEDLAETILP